MVPSDFAGFFAASAAVAGALIGLLFVAVSVAPGWGEPDKRILLDVRAGVAFASLTDALVVSLFALVPGVDLGTTVIAVSSVGLASCAALGLALGLSGPIPGRNRQLVALGAQVVPYLLQLVAAIGLAGSVHDESGVRTQAILVIVFFLVGIARAWELIGARDTGLIHTIRGAIQDRAGAAKAAGSPEDAESPSGR